MPSAEHSTRSSAQGLRSRDESRHGAAPILASHRSASPASPPCERPVFGDTADARSVRYWRKADARLLVLPRLRLRMLEQFEVRVATVSSRIPISRGYRQRVGKGLVIEDNRFHLGFLLVRRSNSRTPFHFPSGPLDFPLLPSFYWRVIGATVSPAPFPVSPKSPGPLARTA